MGIAHDLSGFRGCANRQGKCGVDMTSTAAPLRIATLIKQIPAVEAMRLGSDGRIVRDGGVP
jgi:hypothetical protein